MSVMVPHAVQLWDNISDYLCQDFTHKHKGNSQVTKQTCARHALWCVNNYLLQQGSSLQQFGFQSDSYSRSAVLDGDHPRHQPSNAIACSVVCDYDVAMLESLKIDQLTFIKSLQQYTAQQTPTCMLLQAPGGTGKTHTLNIAIAWMLASGLKVAVTSSTGWVYIDEAFTDYVI